MTKQFTVAILFIICVFGFAENSYSVAKKDSTISIDESLIADAREAYEDMAYRRAINLYEQLVEKNYLNAKIYQRLADSYYKVRNTKKAEEYYKILVTSTLHSTKDVYDLVKVLKYNGKYKEAEKWLERYVRTKRRDTSSDEINMSDKINQLKSYPRYRIDTLPFNTGNSEFGPYIFNDYLYFTSHRKKDEIIDYEYSWDETDFLDIYKISLENLENEPQFISRKINSKYHDGPLCFSDDGTEVYFSSNNKNLTFFPIRGNKGVTHLKIFISKYDGEKFTTPEELSFNSDNYSCAHPSVSSDGDTLYFTSDKNDGYGGSDIYYSVREGNKWSQPVNIGNEINTEGDEMFPFIHKSGDLYFASDRHLGLGGLDIFRAFRKNGKFVVENMGYPLNTRFDDFSIFIGKDPKVGYFASNRNEGQGNDDVYKFTVTKTKDQTLIIQGKILDKKTNERIDNPSVVLKDSEGNTRRLMFFKEAVDYSFSVDPKKEYTVNVNKEGYFPTKMKFSKKELIKKQDIYEHDIFLKKKPVWGISGTVYNAETKDPVDKAKVTVKNRLSAEETTYETSEEGSFRIKLKKNTDYYLHFNKEGFESIQREYYTRGREHGWVNLNDLMDINLIPVKEEEYTYLKGKIKDKSSEEGIKAKLQLIDNDKNKIVATYLSDKNGKYKIRLPEVKKYGVEITAKDYLYFAEQIDFSKMNVQNDIIQKEFALEKIEVGKKVVIENIFFETGKSKLKPESYKSLDKVLKLLKNNKDLKLEIAGHTDNVGSYMANKKLSKNRAKSVVDYLVGHGINQARLEYEGYSFTKPIATNKTSAGRQKNRRVEFEILEK